MPAVGVSGGVVTTQPMVMPRPVGGQARVAPPAVPTARSTQRIVLASAAAGKAGATRVMPPVLGKINLPIGMILRCLPPPALASDISQLEGSGAAATEIGLPMGMVINQLPSGKVEMTLKDLVPLIPDGYLKPAEQLAPYLSTLVSLPLMDVVMRIPPDLLALRPDQKDIDSSVASMADPFTEEVLREQAEAKKRQAAPSQPNIIDEHQVPATEEFVPRDQATTTSVKSFVPPPRPLAGSTIAKTSGLGLSGPPAAPTGASLPPSARTAALPLPPVVRNSSPIPPPAPNTTSRRISPSGRLPTPVRAGSPVPMRAQGAVTTPVSIPQPSVGDGPRLAPPFPGGAARPTVPMPAIVPRTATGAPAPQTPQPPLRPTMPIPMASLAGSGSAPAAPPPMPTVPPVLPPAVPSPSPAFAETSTPTTTDAPQAASPSAFPLPGQPDAAADELQRLAALATLQMESTSSKNLTATPANARAGAMFETTVPVPETTIPLVPEPPSIPPPPAPVVRETPPSASAPTPAAEEKPTAAPEPAVALNLNNCAVADLLKIPGCSPELAESIVRHRAKIGAFRKLEDLLEVPGMNAAAYRSLTGEAPPQSGIPQSLSELLGFPEDQKVTLKDVTDRICCWPDVTGCILGQSTGLSLVGTVPKNFDKAAIVAFAPRMFESINKSFNEIAGRETNELIIPTTGTSFHILRNGELYLIILSRLPQMPDRHVKIARLVLAGLNQLPA